MARARDPNREKAKQMYLESSGEKPLKDIATELNKDDSLVRKWKRLDKWDDELNGHVANENKGHVANERNNISWVEIEIEYVTDIRKKPCTLRGLSEKYGISLQGVKQYAAQNNWTEKRNQLYTNAIQKTVKKPYVNNTIFAENMRKHFGKNSRIYVE